MTDDKEIDELDNLLLPGSDFWKWDHAKKARMLEQLKSRSEHPTVVAMQRQLADILMRAARQLPEVQALVAAARGVEAEWLGGPDDPPDAEWDRERMDVLVAALRDALNALEASAR